MKITIYLTKSVNLALNCFLYRTASQVPMLNERTEERCHRNLSDAIATGVLATRRMVGSKAFAIIHITYDGRLHEELARAGLINGTARDGAGKPVWALEPEACRRLNAAAHFMMEVFPVK
jgi:hypothetical protein